MTAPMVAPSPAPTLYRSLVSGEVVHRDDLEACDPCHGSGQLAHETRVRLDDHGGSRIAVERESCPHCGSVGLVDPLTMHGTTVLGRVEPLVGPQG